MRVVIDTNVALSGLLWGGPPNQLLKWGRDGVIRIPACDKMTEELKRVLDYGRFSKRLSVLDNSPQQALAYFRNLVFFVPNPESIPIIIKADPSDDLFLALAAQEKAVLIVSGDRHLLDLESFKNIQIVTPSEAVQTVMKIQFPDLPKPL